jgi:hypothetical protein
MTVIGVVVSPGSDLRLQNRARGATAVLFALRQILSRSLGVSQQRSIGRDFVKHHPAATSVFLRAELFDRPSRAQVAFVDKKDDTIDEAESVA